MATEALERGDLGLNKYFTPDATKLSERAKLTEKYSIAGMNFMAIIRDEFIHVNEQDAYEINRRVKTPFGDLWNDEYELTEKETLQDIKQPMGMRQIIKLYKSLNRTNRKLYDDEEKLPHSVLEQMLGTEIPCGPKHPYSAPYNTFNPLIKYVLYRDGQGKVHIDYTGELANILGFTDLDITNKEFELPAKPGGQTNIVTYSADRIGVGRHENSHKREIDPFTYLNSIPSNHEPEEGRVDSYLAGYGA